MSDLSIYLILDGSGSMGGVKTEVVDGVNDFLKDQQDDKAATGDDITFSLTVFDDQVKQVYMAEDIDIVKPVKVGQTFLGGSTALYDAIGRTVSKAETNDSSSKKLVVIYTDGHENASREYKADQIKDMIERLQATNDWTFVYMSAELADFAQPQAMGLAAGNVMTGTSRRSTALQFKNLATSSNIHRISGGVTSTSYYGDTMDTSTLDSMGGTLGSEAPPVLSSKLWTPDADKVNDQGDPGDEHHDKK